MPLLEHGVRDRELLLEAVEACVAGAAPICRKILASPSDHYPQLNTRSGNYTMVQGYLPADRGFRWAGFLAGRLWLLHDLTGDLLLGDAAFALARRITDGLQRQEVDRGNVGFDVYHGICLGYEITGSPELFDMALIGARALESLWSEAGQAYRQNGWMDAFVAETPACLLPILWAHRHGQGDVDRIRRHVIKSLEGGMLRPDGSVQHRLFFDGEGNITGIDTSQGYQAKSTWARAQAWMLHSLAACLESFPDQGIYDAFVRSTAWYLEKIPADGVLYYDFDDTRYDEIPRDSCGSLISAVALLRAADLGVEPERCREVAIRTEREILNNYVAPSGVVLHGSWGTGEGKSRWNTLFPQQDVMPYGNYWFAELLHRRLRPASGIFQFAKTM